MLEETGYPINVSPFQEITLFSCAFAVRDKNNHGFNKILATTTKMIYILVYFGDVTILILSRDHKR